MSLKFLYRQVYVLGYNQILSSLLVLHPPTHRLGVELYLHLPICLRQVRQQKTVTCWSSRAKWLVKNNKFYFVSFFNSFFNCKRLKFKLLLAEEYKQ